MSAVTIFIGVVLLAYMATKLRDIAQAQRAGNEEARLMAVRFMGMQARADMYETTRKAFIDMATKAEEGRRDTR